MSRVPAGAALLLVSSLTAVGCDDHGSHAATPRLARLAVADGAAGKVTFLDLRDGSLVSEVALTGASSIYAGPGRRFVFAVNRAAGLVELVDSGIAYVDHGDHGHTTFFEPTKLAFSLTGTAPAHFTFRDGVATLFFDGSVATASSAEVPARVVTVTEASLWRGTPEVVDVELEAAHHGVAVAFADGIFTSADVPVDPAATSNPLPEGVAFVDEAGVPLASFDGVCPGLHGKADLGDDRIAFACATHVVVVERSAGSPWTSRTLAYPDDRRSGTLVGDEESQAIFAGYANTSQASILRYDAISGERLEQSLPAGIGSFDLVHGHEGEVLVVLTIDGVLRTFDPQTLAPLEEVSVVPAFTASHSAPGPRIATTEETVYVSSPTEARVLEVDVEHARITRRFDVAGAPASIVVLGPGHAEDEHGHDHED